MAELSPAAQAVRNAAGRQYAIDGDLQDSIAAALRAAAGQVVVKLRGLGQESAWCLEEIATELENHQ